MKEYGGLLYRIYISVGAPGGSGVGVDQRAGAGLVDKDLESNWLMESFPARLLLHRRRLLRGIRTEAVTPADK